jgi:DEAD/DEAH box helicase domain-containing protein
VAYRIRSSLAGLSYILGNLASLFLMCDTRDLGVFQDSQSPLNNGLPIIVIFDRVPGGIGFSQRLFEIHNEIIERAYDLVSHCHCDSGCPSCVGPGGEEGAGGKKETLALLGILKP